MNRRPLSLALVSLSAAAFGCGGDEPAPAVDFTPRALDAIVTNAIVPSMTKFVERARTLDSGIQAVCAGPDEAAIVELQDEWLELSTAWSEAALYNIGSGPLDDDLIVPSVIYIESMRQRGIEYSDTVRESVDAAMQSADALDGSYFEALQFNRVGLLALEVLLFEGPAPVRSSTVADIVQGYVDQPRRCAYLQGVSTLLAARAEQVHSGWVTDFGGRGPFADTMRAGTLSDGSTPLQGLLLAVGGHFEYLERRKLSGVLDVQVADAARPRLGLFYRNLEAALVGADKVVQASIDGGPSLFNAMSVHGYTRQVQLMQVELQTAREAVEGHDREASVLGFSGLANFFRDEVAVGLNVDLGLNFSDGD